MHQEAIDFLVEAVSKLGDLSGWGILEFGSHNVNGSPRDLFEANKIEVKYTGVDPWAGVGVDVVSRAQDYNGMETFDLVISMETLEHDPDPQGQIESAWRALKKGGKLILTAASLPRIPHRCDGTEGELLGEHYRNIRIEDMLLYLRSWNIIVLRHNIKHGDIYALAEKPG